MRNNRKIVNVLGISLCLLGLSACSPENEQGYSVNPKALQQAMKQCPERAPKRMSCDQLGEVAIHVNALAYKLRMDQQAYGKDILALQETITEQRKTLEKNPDKALNQRLKQNQKLLQEHLAVVRWLASPEG